MQRVTPKRVLCLVIRSHACNYGVMALKYLIYFPLTEFLSHTEPKGPAIVKGATNCKINYAQHLRGVVEKTFPIDVLNRSCSRELGSPTGNSLPLEEYFSYFKLNKYFIFAGLGWATIRLKNFRGTHLEEATMAKNYMINHCDAGSSTISKCDPFVRMKIGGENVLTTDPQYNTENYNVGRTVVSKLIEKNSTIIEIEVLDVPLASALQEPQLMLKKTGTVESFMQTPIQCTKGGKTALGISIAGNCLEIDIIWEDVRSTDPK